jgi:hypothetical protein
MRSSHFRQRVGHIPVEEEHLIARGLFREATQVRTYFYFLIVASINPTFISSNKSRLIRLWIGRARIIFRRKWGNRDENQKLIIE